MADTTVSYTCPHCGAPLTFNPKLEKVKCEYCDSEFDVKTLEKLYAHKEDLAAAARKAQEEKWTRQEQKNTWSEEEKKGLRAFHCSSCGAEIICDENTMATECCYCGNPTLLPSRFEGELKPDYVLPFKKTKEEAVAALKQFYQGKRLLPKAFTANNRVEAIQPMYVPFWLFDAEVTASASFRAETDHVFETEDEIITETNHYQCDREGKMSFHRIPVDGSQKMDDTYMESIEPFDYSDLQPFSAAYLAGFLADKYDVDDQMAMPRADERLHTSAIGVLEDTVTGYDRRQLVEDAVQKNKGTVTYALAPVWILTTRYEDKPYTFMMNGQTGKMVGSLPYDKVKSYVYLAVTTLVLTPVLYWLIGYLLS